MLCKDIYALIFNIRSFIIKHYYILSICLHFIGVSESLYYFHEKYDFRRVFCKKKRVKKTGKNDTGTYGYGSRLLIKEEGVNFKKYTSLYFIIRMIAHYYV